MKSAIKKFLSIILATITLLSTCSATMWAFAADEETSVVDSGFCGLNGDNLKWTLYSDGELVISGTGEMDWYNINGDKNTKKLAPWTNYYDNIAVITIEEGVTSIGNDAFVGDNIQYHKINIPKSLEYFEGNIFDRTRQYQTPGKHIAFCYAGSQYDWNCVKKIGFTLVYNEQTQEVEKRHMDSSYNNNIYYTGYRDYIVLYFDGEKPDDFCKIEKTTVYVSHSPREKIELYAHYYVDDCNDCELVWTIDGDSKFIKGDENKTTSGNEVTIRFKGDTTVNLKIVAPNGEIIAEDDIFLKSSVDTSLSFWERLENRIANTFYMFLVILGVFGGTLGSIF